MHWYQTWFINLITVLINYYELRGSASLCLIAHRKVDFQIITCNISDKHQAIIGARCLQLLFFLGALRLLLT
jgi:hypothetical protein